MKDYFKIVIDTNVLVSGLISKAGASHKLLELLLANRFKANISVPLLFEYEHSLKSEKLLSLYTVEEIDNFLDVFVSKSEKHIIWFLLRPLLKDVNDNLIAELAFASNSEYIITFNKKDFLGVENYGIQVIAPQEFLKILGE